MLRLRAGLSLLALLLVTQLESNTELCSGLRHKGRNRQHWDVHGRAEILAGLGRLNGAKGSLRGLLGLTFIQSLPFSLISHALADHSHRPRTFFRGLSLLRFLGL